MNIRTAKREDVNQLVGLHMEVHDIHVVIEPTVFRKASKESLKRSILRALNDANVTFLVAENERLVGYILLKKKIRPQTEFMHERKCLYIEQVNVLKEYRSKGVFQLLLAEVKELARAWNVNRIELDVWSNNGDARSAFVKSGFDSYNEKMKIDL